MPATNPNSDSDCRSPDTFADLRSASHAQQRARKHRERCRSLARAENPPRPTQTSHYTPTRTCLLYRPTHITCAQSIPTPYNTHTDSHPSPPIHPHPHPRTRRRNHNKHSWARSPGCKADAYLAQAQYTTEMATFGRIDVRGDAAWIEDITYREWEGGNWSEACLQQGATWDDVRREGYTEVGETFGAWGRRRIGEMRGVREARRRAAMHGNALAAAGGEARGVDGGRALTTLPTTRADIEGHAMLARALRPRRRGSALPHAIHDYGFFGEYEWCWHRNFSGCWELASWFCGSVSYSQCYCEAYAAYGRWSPEDRVQPYALEEFIVSSCEGGEAWWGGGEGLGGEVGDVRGGVVQMRDVVDTARREMLKARREVYEEGLGMDLETKDVCDRMGEVYGEIHRLQQGLVELVNQYEAMCDEVGACNTVEDMLQGGDEEKGRAAYDAGIFADGWDVISRPPLSTISSWSIPAPEEES